MDYFTTTLQGYQPIFVGAGCLALGYMYGRHCKSLMENCVHENFPTTSDAGCCAQTESIHVDEQCPQRMALDVHRPSSCSPSDSGLNYAKRGIFEKPGRCCKRNSSQLEIFQMPRKKEDTLWAETSAFKKQKSVETITIQNKEPVLQSKAESEHDSDDEILAERLEYFMNQSASINKPRGRNGVKISMKKNMRKSSEDLNVNYEDKGKGKGIKDPITMDSQTTLSKATTKYNGLWNLATSHQDFGECSLEDTCTLFKTIPIHIKEEDNLCLDGCGEDNTLVLQTNTVIIPSTKDLEIFDAKYTIGNPFEGYLEDDNIIGLDSVGLMDLQCGLNELEDNFNHNMAGNDEEKRPNEDAIVEDNCILSEGGHEDTTFAENLDKTQLATDLTARPLLELHHEKCIGKVDNEEVLKDEPQVLIDKTLKVEIYELLHAEDCAKVSFEDIVSLLEEKLKVVLRKDKAHIVSLVREVIDISKLLEEEKALEDLEQVQTNCKGCC